MGLPRYYRLVGRCVPLKEGVWEMRLWPYSVPLWPGVTTVPQQLLGPRMAQRCAAEPFPLQQVADRLPSYATYVYGFFFPHTFISPCILDCS